MMVHRRHIRLFGEVAALVPALVIAAFMISACTPHQPAPVVHKGFKGPSYGLEKGGDTRRQTTASTAPGKAVAAGGSNIAKTVIIKKGATLYEISRRHGVALRDLIEANNLRPPFILHVGDRLKLPAARLYMVQPGDTVYGLSRRFGLDMTTLARANHIKAPYRISPGQQLRIGGARSGSAKSGVVVASRKNSKVKSTGKTSAKRKKTAVARPPKRSGKGFSWPAKGKILSSYGSKGGGLHNDGINIKVGHGTKVNSAQSGVVAYAGNEMRSYGNLLLIRHDGGWMTAYAHNQRLLVKKGDRVKRGQAVALAGSSGKVKTPQLHFEIRKGSKALDPSRYLGS